MKINEGREAAYVSSIVTDNSTISNNVDFAAFFSVITPKSSPVIESDTYCKKTQDGKIYFLPYLVRDVETLDKVFGDARINPSVFKDLYSVRYLVQQGISCYVSKVYSGTNFESIISTNTFFTGDSEKVRNANGHPSEEGSGEILFRAKSTIAGTADVHMFLKPIKPFSLNQVYLSVELVSILEDKENVVASTSVLLRPDTKNADLVSTINSYLNADLTIELYDPKYDDKDSSSVQNAYDLIEGYVNIGNLLLNLCCLYDKIDNDAPLVSTNMKLHEKRDSLGKVTATGLNALSIYPKVYYSSTAIEGVPAGFTFRLENRVKQSSALEVGADDYVRSLETYNDIKYSGQFITELSANKAETHESYRTLYIKDSSSGLVGKDRFLLEETKDGKLYEGTWSDIKLSEKPNLDIDPMNYYSWKHRGITQGKLIEDTDAPVYDNIEIDHFYTKADESSEYETYDVKITDVLDLTLYVKNPDNNEEYITLASLLARDDCDGLSKLEFTPTTSSSDKEIDPDKNYGWLDDGNVFHKIVFYVKINGEGVELNDNNAYTVYSTIEELSSEERRGLHYTMKMIAAKRKDITCIFTTPHQPKEDDGKLVYFDLQTACDWVASKGNYSNLFNYGDTQAVSYTEQSFYCEIYWSWVKWRVIKLVNGMATGSDIITVPASIFVITNALNSFRLKGTWYPVAGDQGGVLPDSCTIIDNPSLKSQRDQLISYRINPIYDTGTRGIQIYGNETLNAIYSDLSAAHVARTLVSIRSKVDNYSETVKFSLNNEKTWGTWINYVSTRILDPIRAGGGLMWYSVNMGWETTTREDIAKRKINGEIRLQFTSSLEIINVNYIVEASSAEIEK